MIEGFLASVTAHARRPALTVDGETWSYGRLLEASERAAAAVDRETNEAAGRFVALFMQRTALSYVGILGILLSGRAYVPLNPKYPPLRNARMLNQAEASVVVVDEPHLEALREVLDGVGHAVTVLLLGAQGDHRLDPPHRLVTWTPVAAAEGKTEWPAGSDDDYAYMMFTSGSTGMPKGVVITRGNVRAYVSAMLQRAPLQPDDRLSQSFDLTFDLSVHDMFVCWTAGACLCCVPDKALMAPAKFIQDARLTVWFSVPSTIAFMRQLKMLRPGAFPALRHSLFCGEALSAAAAEAWHLAAPNSTIDNLYGPTEATIAFTAHRWSDNGASADGARGLVPIGDPFPGLRTVIVDDDLRPVADGAAGELCVAGPQVSPGYWRDPDNTAERFIAINGDARASRWYRTGDRVMRTPENGLIFLGRTDHQIKILGHRVELGEIEQALRDATNSDLVVALPWPPTESGAGGVVGMVSGTTTSEKDLLAHCKSKLPWYMVPRAIRFVADWPLNANGKADRAKLGELLERDDVGSRR